MMSACIRIRAVLFVRAVFCIRAVFFGFALGVVSLAAQPPQSGVPLADPFVLLHEGVYYAYGTGYKGGFHVYVSRDLVTWEKAAAPALVMEDSFGEKKFWAPEVVYREENRAFYMYYTAEEHLCVATAKSPLGPFKQEVKKPMRAERAIDSTLFVDEDGTPWLYFVIVADGQNVIWGAELERDWVTFKAGKAPFRCVAAEQGWETVQGRVAEGPSVFKRGDVYYMMYSANHYINQGYAVGYATAATPRGPWKKAGGNPVLRRPANGLVGTGHGAPFVGRDGNHYYVFHAHAGAQAVQPRRMYIAPMSIDKEGRLSIDAGGIITPAARR